MENFVNKLNECLKALNITNIKFKKTYSFRPEYRYRIGILLPRMSTHEFDVFTWFNCIDDVFKRSTTIYNDISELRNICLTDARNGYYFAYDTLTPADIKFLEILSKCKSLEEFELKLAIHGYLK